MKPKTRIIPTEKGHSYRPDLNRTEKKYSDEGLTLVRKWTCVNCGIHMEDK